MIRLILILPAVFTFQGILTCFFYRSRAVLRSWWTDSDAIVFGLPLTVGFAVIASLLLGSDYLKVSTSKRALLITGLSAILAAISSSIGIVVGFNLYGT